MSKIRLAAVIALAFAAILGAAEPTLMTAMLPDAELVCCVDKSFEQSPFVKKVSEQVLTQLEGFCQGNLEVLNRVKEMREEHKIPSDVLFTSKFSAAVKDAGAGVDGSRVEYILGVAAQESMTDAFNQRAAKMLATPDADTAMKKVDFRPGWIAYELTPKKEPELKSMMALAPGGKFLFLAPRAVLERQLDKPAPAAGYLARYYSKERTTGPAASVAIVISAPLKKVLDERLASCADDENPNPNASMGMMLANGLRHIELSVRGNDDSLGLKMDLNYATPDQPALLKMLLDAQVVPMIPALGPSLVGANIPLFNSIKSYSNQTHAGLQGKLTEADINALLELSKQRMAGNLPAAQ